MNGEEKELARALLQADFDALSPRDQRVLTRIARRARISRDVHAEFEEGLGFGARLADKVARFGGSWTFIVLFGLLMLAWAGLNTVVLAHRAFDPYPYVFLNLVLSMLAALQAPVIMMSQNRQAARDRLAATHDYEVNLKAELEILNLHSKVDQLRDRQLVELIRSQEEQIRLLTILVARKEGN